MVIQDNIEELTRALANEDCTLLLLCGSQPSKAETVHDYLERNDALEDWQTCFLITDPGVLDEQQRDDWFKGPDQDSYEDRYAVVRGTIPKQVTCTGPISDLLGADEQPSIIEILYICSKRGD